MCIFHYIIYMNVFIYRELFIYHSVLVVYTYQAAATYPSSWCRLLFAMTRHFAPLQTCQQMLVCSNMAKDCVTPYHSCLIGHHSELPAGDVYEL